MQWLLIIIALITAIPTYGISLVVLILIMPLLGAKTRSDMFPQLIKSALYSPGNIYSTEDVYFESAERYGEDTKNVISQSKGHSINFYVLIDGEKINVYIARTFSGGISIIAKNNNEFEKNMHDEFMRNVRGEF